MSLEENKAIFDKCSNENGHGHDYVIEVRLEGNLDNNTGMVVNHLEFENIGNQIVDKLNYKWIDKDIEHFNNVQSTVENLGIYLWDEFKNFYGSKLNYIKVWENSRSYFECFEEKI